MSPPPFLVSMQAVLLFLRQRFVDALFDALFAALLTAVYFRAAGVLIAHGCSFRYG